MINSHLLYQLSYRGSDAAHFIKNIIQVNALEHFFSKVRSFNQPLVVSNTCAIAFAT